MEALQLRFRAQSIHIYFSLGTVSPSVSSEKMNDRELRAYTKLDVLKRHYSALAAEALHDYINDFMPYTENFKNISCHFCNNDKQLLLTLDCPIYVMPPGVNAAAAPRQGLVHPLRVEVVFLANFPNSAPTVKLLPNTFRCGNLTEWRVRPASSIMDEDGAIHLEKLALLEQAVVPYSLLEILVALTEQFEAEFPLTPSEREPIGQNPSIATATPPVSSIVNSVVNSTFCPTDRSAPPNVMPVPEMPTSDPSVVDPHNQLIQGACDAVMIHLLFKADAYLDTRAKALEYLKTLDKASNELRSALATLEKNKEELLKFSPAPGRVEDLTTTLEQVANSMETHSDCIVPADEVHARALELLGDIHSLDDVLELLERSLRHGQITCEEYVRRVSDVGRQQFEARFLFDRLTAAVRGTQRCGTPLPSDVVPTANAREEPSATQPTTLAEVIKQLHEEFPDVELDVVKAVLEVTEMNLSETRVQLHAIMS